MDTVHIAQVLIANGPLIVAVCTAITAIIGLIRSEKLALNPNTPTNGIIQGRLLKAGLAVLPVIASDVAKGVDPAKIIEDVAVKIAEESAAPEAAANQEVASA